MIKILNGKDRCNGAFSQFCRNLKITFLINKVCVVKSKHCMTAVVMATVVQVHP